MTALASDTLTPPELPPAETACCKAACLLTSLEYLQFRDGRPLEAGFLHRGQLPTPQTLTGALRFALLTYFGCDVQKLDEHIRKLDPAARSTTTSEQAFCNAVSSCFPGFEWISVIKFRGPWLMQRFPSAWNRPDELMIPLPTTIQRSERRGYWSLLEPLDEESCKKLHFHSNQAGRLRSLWSHVTEPSDMVEGFIRPEALKRYLERRRGVTLFEDFANDRDQQAWCVYRDELVHDAPTTGIGRNLDTNSVIEGKIFSPCELAFPSGMDENGLPCPSTMFYAELEWTSALEASHKVRDKLAEFLAQAGQMSIGGRGGDAAIERVALQSACQRIMPDTDRVLILATSPVLADNLAAPASLVATGVSLVSACVPRSFAVSGWDAARRCSQPTRFAAAAGSVYFMELTGTEDEKKAQRKKLQELESLSPAPYDSHGWGSFITGTWDNVRLV